MGSRVHVLLGKKIGATECDAYYKKFFKTYSSGPYSQIPTQKGTYCTC